MNFHLFVRNNDFPLESKNLLLKALQAFFKSPRLRPYTDAIARTASDDEREQSYKNIRLFSGQFIDFLSTVEINNVVLFSEQWDKMLKESGQLTALSGVMFEGYLRKSLFWKFSPLIDTIQKDIIALGSKLLAKEHRIGIKALDQSQFYSFEEYIYATWSKARDSSDVMTPTVHQWYGYLKYTEYLLRPFANNVLHTENKKQAVNFIEKIEAICSKLSKATSQLHQATKLYQQLEAEIKDNRTRRGELVMGHGLTTGLHPNQDPNCAVELKEELKALNTAYVPLNHKRLATRKAIATLSNLYSLDGGLDKSSTLYTDCQAELNYWSKNYSRFKNRLKDIKAIHDFSKIKTTGYDVLYRYISAGELTNLTDIKQFNQSPVRCLEREKWFFYQGGNPGDGVTHPVACTVFVKKGTIDLLLSLQREDGLFATVVGKDNEKNCIGIHEDALWALNRLVEKVVAKETKSGKPLKVITFDTKTAPANAPAHLDDAPQNKPKPLVFEFNQLNESLKNLKIDNTKQVKSVGSSPRSLRHS